MSARRRNEISRRKGVFRYKKQLGGSNQGSGKLSADPKTNQKRQI